MKVFIGSDHGGFLLKQYLREQLGKKGITVVDVGCDSTQSVDYPVYADMVCDAVLEEEGARGILCCGTGVGVTIAANKRKGIRAALLSDGFTAKVTKEHNNTNIICFGQRVIGFDLAVLLVERWLGAEYVGGKHARRLKMIEEMEHGKSLY